jgi:hypothetical protein
MQSNTGPTSLNQIIADRSASRLTRIQAAEFLGLKPGTLATDATTRKLNIPFYKVGSKVFYRLTDLTEWENKHLANKAAA